MLYRFINYNDHNIITGYISKSGQRITTEGNEPSHLPSYGKIEQVGL